MECVRGDDMLPLLLSAFKFLEGRSSEVDRLGKTKVEQGNVRDMDHLNVDYGAS